MAGRPAAPPPASPSSRPSSTPSPPTTTPAAAPGASAAGATPATAYTARPKAAPGDRAADTHDRVRTDIIGQDRHRHPAPRRQALPHRRRPDPRRNPRPAARPATCTSASSMPPPASYSASSPSTPAGTTSPPSTRPDPHPQLRRHANETTPNPDVGSGSVLDVLRDHRAPPAGFEPAHPPPEGGALSPELWGPAPTWLPASSTRLACKPELRVSGGSIAGHEPDLLPSAGRLPIPSRRDRGTWPCAGCR